MPKVFISYSHDSPEHSARVLELANALRGHGVDVELDQYHVRPEHGWPHWCTEQLREENAEFVLLVCTETYREGVENKVPTDERRGVYWEGALIYDYLYEAKGNRRFIPILLDGAQSDGIPRRIRNHTRYSIAAFNLDDDGYHKLYRELTRQPAVVKPPLGERIALGPAPSILPPLPVREVKTQFPSVSLEKLPTSGPNFLGREVELKLLDEAWADPGRTQVVVLVAPGGVGKTGLVNHWLDRLKSDGWRGAERVYGWSFYSQGTTDDRQASDDPFLNDALRWFGVEHDPKLLPWDKGRLLAEAVAQSRTLLVLDGLEPLQHPPGPQGGELRAPGVQALLLGLARAGQPGLCVATTRGAVRDLAGYERNGHRPAGGVLAHDSCNLGEADGARLLHRLGVTRAGAAAIVEDDAELRAASHHVRGHALALTLLGGYLKLAHAGDIRKRDLVRFEEADAEAGGHAFKVMEAYEKWFLSAGEPGALKLAAVRLLGLFDRPADPACLAALRAEPVIVGLTEPLLEQSDKVVTVDVKPLTKEEALKKEKFGYTGEKLSLNFQDIEVRAVLQLIADFTGLNMVASDTVAGTVTLRLKNVPWDQALEIIVTLKGLGMRQAGNVMMVAPQEEIAAREKLELESQKQIAELATEQGKLLSERGNVSVDQRTNTRDAQWNITLQRLADCGLVFPAEGNAAVDAHPLVREYFATQLRERQPAAWREGHRRLYEYLISSVPYRPEGLAGLQPLYQAVAHGCKAGLYQEALAEVYDDRILRSTGSDGFYSTNKLGAFGADLGAVACFFEDPWKRLAPALSELVQAWLLNEAATRLRGLGRLTESLEPIRIALDLVVTQKGWIPAAAVSSNLSELELTLGDLAAAERDADQSVLFADRSGDAFQRMSKRTTLANARQLRLRWGFLRRRRSKIQAENRWPCSGIRSGMPVEFR